MSEYSEKLCDEKHNTIKDKLQTIDKRLDNHSDEIKKTNENVQDLKEVLIEVKDLNKRMIDNNNNKSEISKTWIITFGVIVTALSSGLSTIIVTVFK